MISYPILFLFLLPITSTPNVTVVATDMTAAGRSASERSEYMLEHYCGLFYRDVTLTK
jgi:hypothetical protein